MNSNETYKDDYDESFYTYIDSDNITYKFEFFRHSPSVTVLFCIAYIIIFIVGLLGNCLVLMVISRTRIMKTAVYYFIFNLAVADLLVVLFCVPPNLLANIFTPWILGLFVCKTVAYLQGVSVSASINTLVAISVDRAMAICFPMRCQITSRTCKTIIVIIWLYSFTITLPWAIYFELEPFGKDTQICTDKWPSKRSGDLYFVVANVFMCYLLPLSVISFCYILIWHKVWVRKLPGEGQGAGAALMMHRSKIKVIKMLLAVVILFAFSWLPLYTIFARVKFGDVSELENHIIHIAAPVAQWLGASNSCINPILYAFFNNKFRAGFKAILVSRSCCSPLRLDSSFRRPESIQMNQSFLGPKTYVATFASASKMSVRSNSSMSDHDSRKSLVVKVPLDNHQNPRSPYTCLELSTRAGRSSSSNGLHRYQKKYSNGNYTSVEGNIYNGEMTPL